jgi:hypothetical protein
VLLRTDARGVLAIGQASHAWLSGQLARAWGNERFGAVEPLEPVCLAAEQHDVGMAEWDLHPTFTPRTGLPHGFTEMPLETHLELWRRGPRRLITQSRYAALLVSMHGRRLYELRDLETMAPDDAAAVTAFIEDQNALERQLSDALRADPVTTPTAAPRLVERNSDLLWTWDYMSLALCLGWAPCTAKRVPTGGSNPTDVRIDPGTSPTTLTLDPWPFSRPDAITVRCEGRHLEDRYGSESELTAALAAAPWQTVEFTLRPAQRRSRRD